MELSDLKTLAKQTSLSVFTLRKFTRMGMPHLRVGRKILVDTGEFETWFKFNYGIVGGDDFRY